MSNGITKIDSCQIRSVAAQFSRAATAELAEAIGKARNELEAVCGMFGYVADDHPSRAFERAYQPHASKMLSVAESLVTGLVEVGGGLRKMADDFDQADVKATVI